MAAKPEDAPAVTKKVEIIQQGWRYDTIPYLPYTSYVMSRIILMELVVPYHTTTTTWWQWGEEVKKFLGANQDLKEVR